MKPGIVPGFINAADVALMQLLRNYNQMAVLRNPRLDVSNCCQLCIRQLYPEETCPRDRGLPCD